jgi:hypothetical protein
MKIQFTQVYPEVGVSFPFTHSFQRYLSHETTTLVTPSSELEAKHGREFKLVFYISAKPSIADSEVRGPTVVRKTQAMEYTVFLPFDVITGAPNTIKSAMTFLMRAVRSVLASLAIDSSNLAAQESRLIEHVCSDPTMVKLA